MLSFYSSLYIFYTLLALSVLAALILLVSYQRERQNLLLRSCCLLLLMMYAVILVGQLIPQEGNLIKDKYGFCETQALVLNYFFISIHAHATLMTFNNTYVALGWGLELFERHLDREYFLMLAAYAIPVLFIAVPVLSISLFSSDFNDAFTIRQGPFYCSVVRPEYILSAVPFCLLTLPGVALSCNILLFQALIFVVYLLYRTWRARQRTLAYGTMTQLSISYLLRMSFSTFLYISLALGSFIPSLILVSPPDPKNISSISVDQRSPWLNPQLCEASHTNETMAFYARTLCPTPLSFFIASIGLAMFMMYGFGTYARMYYRHFFGSLVTCGRQRRPSALPLMNELPNGAARLSPVVEEEAGPPPAESNDSNDSN